MTIPPALLSIAIWLAIAGVSAGAVYLAVILVRDWRKGGLW